MGEGSKSARRGKEPGHGIFSEVQIQRDSERRFREIQRGFDAAPNLEVGRSGEL